MDEPFCPDAAAAAAMTADLQLPDKTSQHFDDVQAYSFAFLKLSIVVAEAKSIFHTPVSGCCCCGAVVVQGVPGRSVPGPSGSLLPATSQLHAVCCRL